MIVVERRVYRGPSLYAHFPVMRLTVDLGVLEEWPSAKIPGFNDALLEAMPTLHAHTCSFGEAGGFVRRLREDGGTWLGHVLEHVAIELQQLTGAHVSFGKTRGEGTKGRYHVVYEYEEERVGEAAGDLALRFLHHLLPADLRPRAEDDKPTAFDLKREIVELIDFAQRRQLGPSTGSIVRAAEARDVPWMRLNDYSLIQFGHGKYQKRIQATVTSETRHIAVEIASDKEETNRILGDLGLPVPRQRVVRSAEGAVSAAERLGLLVGLARTAGLRLAAQTLLTKVALAFVFSLFESVVIVALTAIFGNDPHRARALAMLVPSHAVTTAAFAPFVFRIAERVHIATIASPIPPDGAGR